MTNYFSKTMAALVLGTSLLGGLDLESKVMAGDPCVEAYARYNKQVAARKAKEEGSKTTTIININSNNTVNNYYGTQPVANTQETIATPQPVRQIQSSLPAQTRFIGYRLETVPFNQFVGYRTVVTTPMPIATALRAVAGIRPVIPDWRKAVVPVTRPGYATYAIPVYTSNLEGYSQEGQPMLVQPGQRLPPPPQ